MLLYSGTERARESGVLSSSLWVSSSISRPALLQKRAQAKATRIRFSDKNQHMAQFHRLLLHSQLSTFPQANKSRMKTGPECHLTPLAYCDSDTFETCEIFVSRAMLG